jgi:hypothetical protein
MKRRNDHEKTHQAELKALDPGDEDGAYGLILEVVDPGGEFGQWPDRDHERIVIARLRKVKRAVVRLA